jgi:transcription initiation factor TFIIB
MVVDESKREYEEVSKTYRLIVRELNLKPPLDDPFKHIPKTAHKLGLSRETELLAVKYLHVAKEKRILAGKDPRGLCAAALYLAALGTGDVLVQRQLAMVCETTEVTLRNRYREMATANGLTIE